MKTMIPFLLTLLFAFGLSAQKDAILVSVYDSISDECGYANLKGEMVIPFGKYDGCFTQKFDKYAIVLSPEKGSFVAIDRNEKELYEVFVFDNGPDYESEGTFRILKDEKIGYADIRTGEILIEPQYDCANPFEKGKAEVSKDCARVADGEHWYWTSNKWFYIDKKGKTLKASKKKK